MAPPIQPIETEDEEGERDDDDVKEEPVSGRLVVGVDGSETAKDAVRWAAKEASLRGWKLELVSAWEIPMYSYAFGYGIAEIPGEMQEGLIERAEEILTIALDAARAEARDVEIETVTAEGQAANVLMDAAEGADLLVVGSRGLGGFRELLLGSVSQQCAQHAPCPVVVVRHVVDEAA